MSKAIEEILEKLYNSGWVEGSQYDDTLEQAGTDTAPRSDKELRRCNSAKAAIKALIAKAEREAEALGYGRGTIDTLNHVKAWADKTEETYNDMMSDRLATLTKEEKS